jgi:hypothetical protein
MNNNSKAKWLRESKEIGQQRQARKRKEAKVKAEREAALKEQADAVAQVEKVKSCLTNDAETKQSDSTPEEQAAAAATVRRLLGGAQ